MTLKEQVATLLHFTPRGPLEIAELLRAPLPDVADAILTLISEGKIYIYLRAEKEWLFLRRMPIEPSLTEEKRIYRFEARSYSPLYENPLK